MEENNLNVAPTLKELDKVGFTSDFEDDSNFVYTKTICDNLNLNVYFENNEIHSLSITVGGHFIKNVEPTKAAINAEFKHFGQPLPQWEQPKTKVGEVWRNGGTVYLINDTVLKNTIRVTIVEDNELDTGTIISISPDILTKLANSLEEYYRQKFLKEGVTSMLYEAKEETTEKTTLENFKPTTIDVKSQVETAHEYSYKGLKAKGKIPHDRSGEDHDSIEALKKLLAICESLNGMFIGSDYHFPYFSPYGLSYTGGVCAGESPICFTSKEAFEAFRSAPENIELFKTFLKIK